MSDERIGSYGEEEGEPEAEAEAEPELPEGAQPPLATDPILGDRIVVPTYGGDPQDPQPESQPRPDQVPGVPAEEEAPVEAEPDEGEA